MIKTAKVTEINGEPKPFTNSYGTTYYHNLVMDNGDRINIGKKSQVQVGWELTYELTGEDDGQQEYLKAKSAKREGDFKPSTGSNDNRQQSIVRQTCLKAASEFHAQSTVSAEEVIQTAEKFEAWVNR